MRDGVRDRSLVPVPDTVYEMMDQATHMTAISAATWQIQPGQMDWYRL